MFIQSHLFLEIMVHLNNHLYSHLSYYYFINFFHFFNCKFLFIFHFSHQNPQYQQIFQQYLPILSFYFFLMWSFIFFNWYHPYLVEFVFWFINHLFIFIKMFDYLKIFISTLCYHSKLNSTDFYHFFHYQ